MRTNIEKWRQLGTLFEKLKDMFFQIMDRKSVAIPVHPSLNILLVRYKPVVQNRSEVVIVNMAAYGIDKEVTGTENIQEDLIQEIDEIDEERRADPNELRHR